MEPSNVPFCTCKTPEKVGIGVPNYAECSGLATEVPLRKSAYTCDQTSKRTKRSLSGNDLNDDNYISDEELYSPVNTTVGLIPIIDWATPGPAGGPRQLTEDEARDLCTHAIQGSAGYQECQATVDDTALIAECILDLFVRTSKHSLKFLGNKINRRTLFIK